MLPAKVIYREGDASEKVYLIKSGRINIVDTYPETGQVVSKSLGPGRVFGEIELIDSRPRSSTAQATGEVKLTVFSHEEIVDMLFDNHEKKLALRQRCLRPTASALQCRQPGWGTGQAAGRDARNDQVCSH